MKVGELLISRRENWKQLDGLCRQLETTRKHKVPPTTLTRFAALYRAACADLALAESYQLPQATIQYLHNLVGRAHNQLYPSRRFDLRAWREELLVRVPERLFFDRSLWLAFALFWGVFVFSAFLAAEIKVPGMSRAPMPGYAERLVGDESLEQYQQNFSQPLEDRDPNVNVRMAGFYLMHNTGIGLTCFALGLLFGVGGMFATVYNAAILGAVFGFFTRVPESSNFYSFVTAHGPFELTAIVLSAAAGMRMGFALIDTGGYSRITALRRTAKETMPTMCAAMILFALAGLIEGFISPTGLDYWIKALIAVVSSGSLVFYFVMLGMPGIGRHATG
jgi:uncharacterized membrane protein SpoIIM required for sporulation